MCADPTVIFVMVTVTGLTTNRGFYGVTRAFVSFARGKDNKISYLPGTLLQIYRLTAGALAIGSIEKNGCHPLQNRSLGATGTLHRSGGGISLNSEATPPKGFPLEGWNKDGALSTLPEKAPRWPLCSLRPHLDFSLTFCCCFQFFAHFHGYGRAVELQSSGHGLYDTGKILFVQFHDFAVKPALCNDPVSLFQGGGKFFLILLTFDLWTDHKKIGHYENQYQGQKLSNAFHLPFYAI